MPKKKKGARRDTTPQAQVEAAPVTEWDTWLEAKEEVIDLKLSPKDMKTWRRARKVAVKQRGFKDFSLEDRKKAFIKKMIEQGQEVILTKTDKVLVAQLMAQPAPQVAPKMPACPLNMGQVVAVRKYFERLGWAKEIIHPSDPGEPAGSAGSDKARETEHLIWNSRYFKTFRESGVWEEGWQEQVKLREIENARLAAAGKSQASELQTPPSELWITRNAGGRSDRYSYYLSVLLDILYNCFLNNLYGYSDCGDWNRYRCWVLNNPNDMTTLFGAKGEKIGWRNYLKMMESFIIEDFQGNRICSISAFVYDILYNMVNIERSLDRKLVMKDLPRPHSDEPSLTLKNIPFNYLKMIINEARATGKVSVDKITFTDALIKMNADAEEEAKRAKGAKGGRTKTRLEMRSMSLTELVEHAGKWFSDQQVQILVERVDEEIMTYGEKKVLEVLGPHIFVELLKIQPEEPHIIQMMIAAQLVNTAVNPIEVAPVAPVAPAALEKFESLTQAWERVTKVTTPIWGEWYDNEKDIDETITELYSTLLDYLFPEVVKTKTPEEEEAERASEAAAAALREEEDGMEEERREVEAVARRKAKAKEKKREKKRRERERGRERGRAEPDDEDEDGREGEREDGDDDEGDIHSDEVLSEMVRPLYDKCSYIYGGDFKEGPGAVGKGIDFTDIAGISIQIYHFLKHKTIKFIVGKLSVYFDLDDPRTFWIALIMFCLIYFANRHDFDSDFMVKGGISLILNTHREKSSTSDKVKIPINDIDISIKPDENERPVILFKLASVILCSGVLLLNRGNTFNRCESDTTRRTYLQELSGSEFERVVQLFADRRHAKFSFEYLVDEYPLPANLKEFIIETEENESIENLRKYIDLNYTEWSDSDGNHIKILQIGNKGTQGEDDTRAAYDASYICDLVIEEQPFKDAHLMSGGDDATGNPLPADMEEWSSFSETFFGDAYRPISYFIYRSLDGNIDSYKKMAEDCLSLGLELINLSLRDHGAAPTFISQLRGNFSNKNGKLEKFRKRLFTFGQTLSGDNVPDKILRFEAELFAKYYPLLSKAVADMISADSPSEYMTALSETEAYIDFSDEKGYDIGLREGLNIVLRAKMRVAFAKRGGGKLYKRSKSKRYKRKKTKKKKRKKTRKKTKIKSINII